MEVIDSALRKISENQAKKQKTHLVFATSYYSYFPEDSLKPLVLRLKKKNKMKSVMVTVLWMRRWELITTEEMENFCNGKKLQEYSVNDDLESLSKDLRLGKEPDDYVKTYFLPKLTEEELQLVEREEPNYLKTFTHPYPDVDEGEMMLSDSDSKFVRGHGWRRTFTIENPF